MQASAPSTPLAASSTSSRPLRPSVIRHTSEFTRENYPCPPERSTSRQVKLWRDTVAPDQQNGRLLVKESFSAVDVYLRNVDGNVTSISNFLARSGGLVKETMTDFFSNRWRSYKIYFWLEAKFKKPCSLIQSVDKMSFTYMNAAFKTTNYVVTASTDLSEVYSTAMESLLEEVDEFHSKGSGWGLSHIDGLLICASSYAPLQGSHIDSYRR